MSELISAGDVLHDPQAGIRVTLIELRPDGFIVDETIEPHKVPNTLNHFHQTWTEQFEIISGTGRYSLDNKEYAAAPGDCYEVKPGQAHIHPWNTGAEPLRFRQSDVFNPVDPTAAVDTFLGFSTLFALAREGKTNQDGTPKNPLQGLVVIDFFRQHGGYIYGVPVGVQNIMMGGGAALGKLFGYRAWYEKWLPKNVKQ